MSLRPRTVYNQYRGHERISGPEDEPVTLPQLKAELRIDDDTEDDSLALYIETAREYIEEVTGLALGEQEWRLTLDHWPSGREPWWDGVKQLAVSELAGPQRELHMPRYPLRTVDSIEVFDAAGNGESVSVSDTFIVDTSQRPGRLVLDFGATWPTALQNANAIVIDYTAGYTSIPAPLRLAVLRMASHLYEHRAECTLADAYAQSGAKGLADKYKAAGL